MIDKWGKRRWLYKLALTLGLSPIAVTSHAQTPSDVDVLPLRVRVSQTVQPESQQPEAKQPEPIVPPVVFSVVDAPTTNIAPVSVIPNFLGGFTARGAEACVATRTTQTLTFTGAGAEGIGALSNTILAPVTANGPGGPHVLTNNIPYTKTGPTTFVLAENGQLTPLVRTDFPGASFVNGGGLKTGFRAVSFFYNYLFTSGLDICVDLPNPAGGGLVGRNKYFDDGSPVPHDRVYFFYNHVGSYRGLHTPFDINRYVFGVEKTFFDGLVSVDVRVPFAGTADSDQFAGQSLAVNDAEFGNVGLALKAVLVRTPNLLVSAGIGISAPTADDSRMFVGNVPVVVLENETWILQPLLGVAYAPTDRFYAQFAAQFDFDPQGNPVQALNSNGGLTHIGTLNDQSYAFLHGAAGYWIYQSTAGGGVSGIALQGELHYDRSMGTHDEVRSGGVTVTDQGNNFDILSATAGVVCRFGNRAVLSVGVSFPLNDRLYDYNLSAQVNWFFGPQ